ncbi:MAG: PD40 domain-containing protein [Nitrospiraceae bacterium]|nr:MAG: PD40 domain-containing protein [Nitrospiraceae bacterium]
MRKDNRSKTTDIRLQTKDLVLSRLLSESCALCSALCVLCSLFFVLSSFFFLLSAADAKIYIDISSPGIRQLPISIHTSGHSKGKDIERVIMSDLAFTDMFSFVDPDIPGAEITVKLDVHVQDGLKVILTVSDLIEGREVLKKRYDASKIIVRTMAHSIANDIYQVATGKEGIFRTKLSYLVNTEKGRKELRIMDWDGYNFKRVVKKGLTSSHSWTQDGKYLLYSSERKREWQIYALDLKSYRESVLFSSKGLNLVGGTSPDNLISFSSSRDGSSEIYTINIYGKKIKKLTRSFGIDVSPVFSPDGKQIAFVSDRGGSPQIYVMQADGRAVHRVTFEGTYNTSPVWSAGGKRIAFVGRKNGKNQIFMVQSDGKDLMQLTYDGNNEGPSFSPDGLFLAFDSDRDNGRGLYIMRANGENQKRVTPRFLRAMAPEWSPYLN